MRFLSTLETKSFLIGFKTELPSPTVNPEPPFFIGVTASWLTQPAGLLQPLPLEKDTLLPSPWVPSLPHHQDSWEPLAQGVGPVTPSLGTPPCMAL